MKAPSLTHKEILLRFVHENAAIQLAKWVVEYSFSLRITSERKTKLGDYRHPHPQQPFHKITLNGNLNQYSFIITFVHELAHLRVWNSGKKRVQPHGIEWKNDYFSLLTSINNSDFFPEDVQAAIRNHLQKIKSSTSYDLQLMKVLMKYDNNILPITLISDISEGTKFTYKGLIFEKGEKIRTRIKCKCINNKRFYTFSQATPVEL